MQHCLHPAMARITGHPGGAQEASTAIPGDVQVPSGANIKLGSNTHRRPALTHFHSSPCQNS